MRTRLRHVREQYRLGPQSWSAKIFFSLLGNLMAPIAGLATAPILARGLGVDGRGELAAAQAPLLMATAIGMLGLQESLTFYVARYKQGIRQSLLETTVLVTGLGIVVSFGIWFVAEPLSAGNATIESLIKVAAIATIPNFLIAVPRALVAGTQQWHLQAIEAAALGFLRLMLLMGLYLSGNLTTFTALLVMLGSPVLSAFLYMPYIIGRLGHGFSHRHERDISYRALIGFGLRVWIGSLSGIILSRIDQLLMVPLASAEQLGLYVVAVTVGEVPVLLSGAMRNVVFSADAESAHTDDTNSSIGRLQQTARIAAFLTLLASFFVVTTAWWWVPLLFGQAFIGSVPIITVLLIAAVLGAPGSIAGAGLSARKRPELRSLSMVLGAVLNVSVLLLLVPQIGAMGAAIATVVGSIVAGTLNIVALRILFGIKFFGFYGLRKGDLQVLGRVLVRLSNKLFSLVSRN